MIRKGTILARLSISCEECGSVITDQPSRIKRRGRGGPRRFCSRSCWRASQSKSPGTISTGYRMYQNGRVRRYEHRIVMERLLGRPLTPGESVHHKNGDRLDNRPENLELWDKHQPTGQRVSDKIDWAILYLEQHGIHVEAPRDATLEIPCGAHV